MNYKLLFGILLLSLTKSVLCIKKDYQEQMEAAIVRTDLHKIGRLTKRYNTLPIRRFKEMVAWADDIVEERRMLDPTAGEALKLVGATYLGCSVAIASLFYYMNWGNFKTEMEHTIPGRSQGFKTLASTLGLISSYWLYSSWAGPRNRLEDAFSVKYALEDRVDELIAKKRKKQK